MDKNYKILIADDEKVIREGLANFVDWKSLNFDLVGVMADGKGVIEYLEKNTVDVILTDIKMTFVSGLDIAKYVFENKLPIKVVLLSGFKEFELAQKAISYNVQHYLTKPFEIDEIQEVFNRIKVEMDFERENLSQINRDIESYEEIKPLIKEQFFTDLFFGGLKNKEEIEKILKFIGLEINPYDCLCNIIEINFLNTETYKQKIDKYGKDKFYISIKNFIEQVEQNISYSMLFNKNEKAQIIAISMIPMEESDYKERLKKHLDNLGKNIQSMLGLETDTVVGRIYYSLMDIAPNKHSVRLKHNVKGTKEDFKLLIEVEDYERLVEQQKLLMSHINAGNFEHVSNLLDSLMESLKGIDIVYAKNYLIDLFSMLSKKLKDIGIDIYIETKGKFDYQNILKINNIDDIQQWCKATIAEVIDCVSKFRVSSQEQFIKQAKAYIDENYSKDVSLDDVADSVFLSSVYFSRLFKKMTGENFIDYLIKVRMNKAIELLGSTHYKTYEISNMIGYKNSRYFSRLFKQYTGYTPTEYRSNLLKGGGKINE